MTEGVTTPGAGWRRAAGPGAQKNEKRRRNGGRRSGRRAAGEVAMVEDAEFTSYYGRPVLKAPVWEASDLALYLFMGGAAGSSSLLGALGQATGRPTLAKVSRYAAALGSLGSVVCLVHDLGRPERFLHMLRVFKPTSPMSVGTYILSPFSAFSVAGAGLQLLGRLPRLRNLAGALAAVFGAPLASYTAVLLSNTAVPSWHEPHAELPFVFTGSALAAGGGITMIFTPLVEAGPSRKMAVTGAAIELAAMRKVENGHGIVSEPYHLGRAGKLLRVAKACTATGAGLTVVAGRTRLGAVASGTLLAAGSLLTRFGVFYAGVASAEDPKYTVVPQRERLAVRQNGHAPSVSQ